MDSQHCSPKMAIALNNLAQTWMQKFSVEDGDYYDCSIDLQRLMLDYDIVSELTTDPSKATKVYDG